jgi:hypothetical protein
MGVNLRNEKGITVKRNTIAKTFTIAAFTAFALFTGPAAKAADKGCSLASLTGTFAYTVTGALVAAPAPIGPYGEVGTQTFDGKGGVTVAGMSSINGNIGPVSSAGTYIVNTDCTGTFILPIAPGVAAHYFFALSDSGAGFQAVCLDSVAVITRTGRRQFPVGDWRQ